MNWIKLISIEELENIYNSDKVHLIFKHSTRCPVSSMAKRSLEFDADLVPENLPCYYLDLIAYRDISSKIAELWSIKHESPQILITQGDRCIYNASHSDIDMRDIMKAIA